MSDTPKYSTVLQEMIRQIVKEELDKKLDGLLPEPVKGYYDDEP